MPKTFILVKDMCEYFKPKIQYDAEHHDKQDYITELFIRGWKIEANLMNVLQETMPFSEKLTSIKFVYIIVYKVFVFSRTYFYLFKLLELWFK